ncbi:hypothetical protein AX15_005533 [Amanita polypyramis BW_CC]|nr:hypothetical protein AX15_005533 [Amanita polypyramis BW_CC]
MLDTTSNPLGRKILYSLFGEPMREDIGTTIDGHRAYDQISPMNPTLILTLMLSAVLFAIYMWFYLSPLFRDQPPTFSNPKRSSTQNPPHLHDSQYSSTIRVVDPEMNMVVLSSDEEKKSLISWIHRSSLGRFIDITGHIHKPDNKKQQHAPAGQPAGYPIPIGFIRGPLSPLSMTPQSSYRPMLTPPPPAYAARPDGPSQYELKRHQSPPSPTLTSLSIPTYCNSPTYHCRARQQVGTETGTGLQPMYHHLQGAHWPYTPTRRFSDNLSVTMNTSLPSPTAASSKVSIAISTILHVPRRHVLRRTHVPRRQDMNN